MSEEFEIFEKEVEIGGKTYKLLPLSGKFLPKLYGLLDTAKEKNEGEEIKLDSLDSSTIEVLHELAFETFKSSYPDKDKDTLDRWISQNLILLFEPLITVNFNQDEIEKLKEELKK